LNGQNNQEDTRIVTPLAQGEKPLHKPPSFTSSQIDILLSNSSTFSFSLKFINNIFTDETRTNTSQGKKEDEMIVSKKGRIFNFFL
jgi:hypothetical protein